MGDTKREMGKMEGISIGVEGGWEGVQNNTRDVWKRHKNYF